MKLKDIRISSIEMVVAICSKSEVAKRLLNTEKRYNGLLQVLISVNYYHDGAFHIPSFKELSTKAGIKYSNFRPQLKSIYRDLMFLEDLEYEGWSDFDGDNVG